MLGEMVHAADWTPTLLDIAGVSSKKTKDMDGFSLFKNLKQSSTTSWPRESAILDMHYGTEVSMRDIFLCVLDVYTFTFSHYYPYSYYYYRENLLFLILILPPW